MKILIATDGSEFSRRAVEKGCDMIAPSEKIIVKILSGVEHLIPMAAEPFAVSTEYHAQIEADLREQSKKAVAEAEKIVRAKLPAENLSVETQVFTGNVKQSIVDEAEKFGANLIVVGSHGYGFFDRMLLGSVSDYVVHHAPCSVLIVRSENDKA